MLRELGIPVSFRQKELISSLISFPVLQEKRFDNTELIRIRRFVKSLTFAISENGE